MGYSGKTLKQVGLKTYSVVGKTPRNFKFCYFTLKNFGQNKASPMEIPQYCVSNVLHPWNSKTKYQNPLFTQICLDFGIFTCFLMNSWKLHMLFLNNPGNCALNSPVCLFFSGIAQWMVPIASSHQPKTLQITRYPYIQLIKLY